MTTASPTISLSHQRRIVTVLSIGQVLAGVGMGAAVSLGALLAAAVAHADALAGLASTMITLGAAAFALPLAKMAGSRGRRPALALGAAAAAVGGAVVILAAMLGWFPLLLLGFGVLGAGSAVNLQTRFAAVDLADPGKRGRDLSLVIWATTVGVVLGPNLAPPGDVVGRALGMPPLTGAFALTIACQLAAAALYLVALRPDPLLTAQAQVTPATATATRPSRWRSFTVLRENRAAMAAVIALALSHATMVGIMAMTPVHLKSGGATIAIVGLTISIHTAGMYGLSPVFGALSDRIGRVRVILAGQAALVASLVLDWAGAHSEIAVMAGLSLLGLGWSASTIAGSAMLADALTVEERPGVQGLSDTIMNLSGAAGGALAGLVFAWLGYGMLNVVTLILVAVVVASLTTFGRRGAPLISQ